MVVVDVNVLVAVAGKVVVVDLSKVDVVVVVAGYNELVVTGV